MMLGTLSFAARPLARTLRLALFVGTSLTLASCAGLSNSELFPNFGGESETSTAAPDEAINAEPLAQQPVDPLSAPPPDAMGATGAAGDGSQRVPLGALTAGDLAAGSPPKAAPVARSGPAPLVPSGQPAAAPKPPMPAAAAAPAPTPQPQAIPAPTIQAQAPQVPAPQAPMPPAPAPPAVSPPVVSPPAAMPLPQAPAPRMQEQAPVMAQQSVEPSISREFVPDAPMAPLAAPVVEAREFVPAQIGSNLPAGAMGAPGAPRLTVADSNIMRRFQALSMLLDDGLITQEEYDRRRAANAGAMLPYSKEPPGIGLDRAVPSSNAIAARLQALGRSLEMRAITPRQHSMERLTILNSLMPERPDPRAPKAVPPTDMFAAADAAGRLAYLRDEELISEDEFETEKAAMERLMRGGDAGVDKKSATKVAAAKPAPTATAASADSMAAEAANDPLASQKFRGPVLHLASFRTEQAARNAYAQAIAKNPAQFANLKPEYRKTDLGEKQGIFYRLLVGPFETLSEAEAACIEMKKVDQFCRSTPDGS